MAFNVFCMAFDDCCIDVWDWLGLLAKMSCCERFAFVFPFYSVGALGGLCFMVLAFPGCLHCYSKVCGYTSIFSRHVFKGRQFCDLLFASLEGDVFP